jgi:hypothetical protein
MALKMLIFIQLLKKMYMLEINNCTILIIQKTMCFYVSIWLKNKTLLIRYLSIFSKLV